MTLMYGYESFGNIPPEFIPAWKEYKAGHITAVALVEILAGHTTLELSTFTNSLTIPWDSGNNDGPNPFTMNLDSSSRRDAPLRFSFQNYKSLKKPVTFNIPRPNVDADDERLVFPVPPATFSVSGTNSPLVVTSASGQNYSHAGPREMRVVTFEGFLPYYEVPVRFFPSYIPQDSVKYGILAPADFCSKMMTAMNSGQPAQFTIENVTSSDKSHPVLFSAPVVITSFTWDIQSGTGLDRNFSITLTEWQPESITLRRTAAKRPTSGGGGGAKPPAGPKPKTYVVRQGDCLWNIAKKFYKDGSKWPTIYNKNKKVLNDALIKRGQRHPNPNLIYAGTKLVIPPHG